MVNLNKENRYFKIDFIVSKIFIISVNQCLKYREIQNKGYGDYVLKHEEYNHTSKYNMYSNHA